MIDLHHHCLPGVDDGPSSLAEAIDLCKMAADEGIDTTAGLLPLLVLSSQLIVLFTLFRF